MADADGNNDYEVTVVVTDSAGNKATRDVMITITNAEEIRFGEGLEPASRRLGRCWSPRFPILMRTFPV